MVVAKLAEDLPISQLPCFCSRMWLFVSHLSLASLGYGNTQSLQTTSHLHKN